MKFTKSRILAALIILFILIQFVPINRTNPSIETELKAPLAVQAILERSCYDCHSNKTTWPFYTYIAPVSWLVAKDVKNGRRHVNFSTWNRYDADRLTDIYDDIYDEIDEDGMPLWFYLPLHPKSKLTENDKMVLKDWVVQANAAQAMDGSSKPDDTLNHENEQLDENDD